jgi:hypothetical protein
MIQGLVANRRTESTAIGRLILRVSRYSGTIASTLNTTPTKRAAHNCMPNARRENEIGTVTIHKPRVYTELSAAPSIICRAAMRWKYSSTAG